MCFLHNVKRIREITYLVIVRGTFQVIMADFLPYISDLLQAVITLDLVAHKTANMAQKNA